MIQDNPNKLSNLLQDLSKYVLQQWKCIHRLLSALGLGIMLFYFGNVVLDKSFTFRNSTARNSKPFNLALNITSNSTLPTLCIVARIYWGQISYFPVLAFGLYHTALHNIRLYVINTDNRTDIQQLEQTIQFINDLVLRPDFVTFLDLGQPPMGNDFGYGMTDRALTYLYQQHMNSSSICEYVTFTNADNFYSRNFAKKILPHMKTKKDMIGWSFTSHHYKPQYREWIDRRKKTVPEIVDDGTEKCTPVELKSGFADLGAVAYRLSFLQKHNLYFQQPGITNYFAADGYFVNQASRRTNASIILRQTLFVHQ